MVRAGDLLVLVLGHLPEYNHGPLHQGREETGPVLTKLLFGGTTISLFYRWGNRGSQRLSDLPEVIYFQVLELSFELRSIRVQIILQTGKFLLFGQTFRPHTAGLVTHPALSYPRPVSVSSHFECFSTLGLLFCQGLSGLVSVSGGPQARCSWCCLLALA